MLETPTSTILNHESLIATKARRITFAAGDRPIMEFGALRKTDSAIYGARAAVIGGAASTSNVLAVNYFPSQWPALAFSWIEAYRMN